MTSGGGRKFTQSNDNPYILNSGHSIYIGITDGCDIMSGPLTKTEKGEFDVFMFWRWDPHEGRK